MPVQFFHGDQRPGEVVSVSYDLDPHCFGWEIRGCMEVLDRTRQAWDIVHIFDCFPCGMVGIETLYLIEDCCGSWDGGYGVDGFTSRGSIDEEGVHVEVCDLVSEGYSP